MLVLGRRGFAPALVAALVPALVAAAGWTELPAKDAPPPLMREVVVFAGDRMVVMGHLEEGYGGSVLDLKALRWTPIPPLDLEQVDAAARRPELPALSAPHRSGDELYFYFGHRPAEPGVRDRPFATGARLDLARLTWKPMQREGAMPAAGASLVRWSGGRLFVLRMPVEGTLPPEGGLGAVYEPSKDRWVPISSGGAPARPREASLGFYWQGAATGTALYLFGRAAEIALRRPEMYGPGRSWQPGQPPPPAKGEGPGYIDAAYDFATRTWRRLPPGAPKDDVIAYAEAGTGPRSSSVLVISGNVEGGAMEGGEYDPARNAWTPVSPPALGGRGRAARPMDGGLVGFQDGCSPGNGPDAHLYSFYDPGTRKWTHTRQPTRWCSAVDSMDERSAMILEIAGTQVIALHLYELARGGWRHAELPLAGGPPGMARMVSGYRSSSRFDVGALHWDGRRLISWGGMSGRNDPALKECERHPGDDCMARARAGWRTYTGYWIVPQWR